MPYYKQEDGRWHLHECCYNCKKLRHDSDFRFLQIAGFYRKVCRSGCNAFYYPPGEKPVEVMEQERREKYPGPDSKEPRWTRFKRWWSYL